MGSGVFRRISLEDDILVFLSKLFDFQFCLFKAVFARFHKLTSLFEFFNKCGERDIPGFHGRYE